jgi:hypothetical protein
MITAQLHSNGNYLVVTCVFVAAGMCLPSRCLAMKIYSDFAIPAFGSHVAILLYCTVGCQRDENSGLNSVTGKESLGFFFSPLHRTQNGPETDSDDGEAVGIWNIQLILVYRQAS